MANYNLVIDSTFQPFSYQEMLAPVMMAQQAHQAIEDEYTDLSTKASVWENMANEQQDPLAYKMYKQYATDLSTQADMLASEGLNVASRRSMLDMKRRYAKEITPIEQAYARRRQLAEEQRQALAKDPTLMYQKYAHDMSLDDFIRNPEAGYGASYSGKMLTSQVATAAGSLAKQMQDNPRKWRSILGDQYYETMMQKGFSAEAVRDAINNKEGAATELRQIVEDAIGSSRIRDWDDAIALKRAYDYANQGLWSAVGETTYQVQANKDYDYRMQNWLAEEKERRAKASSAEESLKKLAINPMNIYSSKERTEINSNLDKYSKYFTKDSRGRTILTEEGMKEYRSPMSKSYSTSGAGSGTSKLMNLESTTKVSHVPSEFKKFMDSIGMNPEQGTIDNWDSAAIGKLWDKYVTDNDVAKYDATKLTEFDFSIHSSQQEDWKNAILTAARNGKLEEVDYDRDSKKFKGTGESISLSDLKDSKWKVVATRFSPYGNTAMIQDSDGNTRRVQMPAGINITQEYNRDANMSKAVAIQQALATGKIIGADGNEVTITPTQRIALQKDYERALQSAYLYHSQLGVQNKVGQQEYHPFGN